MVYNSRYNEEDFIKSSCSGCRVRYVVKDLTEYYDKDDLITWFDGSLKPRLKTYCKDCYNKRMEDKVKVNKQQEDT